VTSKAESIADAVADALTTPTMTSVPAARVFRDMAGAVGSAALPAIAVETGDEAAPVRATIGHKMRQVDIRVVVVASGANPFTAADAAVVESFNRLSAAPTLGGLAFEFDEGETRRERADGEQNMAAVTKVYRYKFRTTEASLES
jgi:hypothetical protein